MSRLKELAVEHSYYCSESNFYSNEAAMRYGTMSAFLDAFEDADIDMNMCFRWDVHAPEADSGRDCYSASVFLMQQRKGRFVPVSIAEIVESDVERFEKYLRAHHDYLIDLWNPISAK